MTNMRREESVFEIDASAQDRVREGVAKEGSNLTGVTGLCAWEDPDDFAGTWLKDTQQSTEEPTVPGHRADFPLLEGEVQSLLRERLFEDMHIQLNLESGSLLPLALRFAQMPEYSVLLCCTASVLHKRCQSNIPFFSFYTLCIWKILSPFLYLFRRFRLS